MAAVRKAFGCWVNNVQRVDDAREITQDGEQNVDEQIRSAAALEEDAQRRQDDGKNDLADITIVALQVSGWNTSTNDSADWMRP